MFQIRKTQVGRFTKPDDYCQAHQLVRIKTGSQYLSITGTLTTDKHQALVIHPDHFAHIETELKSKYKGMLFITESNRN